MATRQVRVSELQEGDVLVCPTAWWHGLTVVQAPGDGRVLLRDFSRNREHRFPTLDRITVIRRKPEFLTRHNLVVKLTLQREAGPGVEALYAVRQADNDCVIGFVTKFRDTRTDTHPWKAYLGYGLEAQHLGAFYDEDGGKGAAVAVICRASQYGGER